MPSKRFSGKLCVYCSSRLATTGDHIFAREFFLPAVRRNLPQAPACVQCNNAKSKLEHYLTTVLPFAGRHPDAQENLAALVPDRLAKNQRLARELSGGRGHTWQPDGASLRLMLSIPLDSAKVCDLFGQVVRGLIWHHWGFYMGEGDPSKATFLTSAGSAYFARLQATVFTTQVEANVGQGTVTYSGARSDNVPHVSLWRIRFYGGLMTAGDPSAPGEISTEIGVAAGPLAEVTEIYAERREA